MMEKNIKNTQQPTIKNEGWFLPLVRAWLMDIRTPTETTLSFRFVGNPPAQWRARFTFRGGPWRTTGRAAPNREWFYGPDARNKAIFHAALTAAMADLVIALLPFVGVRTGLQEIHCEFFLPRPRNDFERHGLVYLPRENSSLYPGQKDVDNRLKYFMDALVLVFYIDDNCIVDARVSKAYPACRQPISYPIRHPAGRAEVRVSSIQ
jgi:hypothetical protein